MLSRWRALLDDNPILQRATPWRRSGRRLWIVAPFMMAYATIAFIGGDSPPFAVLAVFLLVPLLFVLLKPALEPSLAEQLYLSGMNPRAIQVGLVFWPLVMTGVAVFAYLLSFAFVHGILGWPLIPQSWMVMTMIAFLLATATSLAFVLGCLFTQLARPSLMRLFGAVILVIGSHFLAMYLFSFLMNYIYPRYGRGQWVANFEDRFIVGVIISWMTLSAMASVLAFRSIPGWAIYRMDRPADAADTDPDSARVLWRRLSASRQATLLFQHTTQVARLRPGILVASVIGYVGMLILLSLQRYSTDYGVLSVLVERDLPLYLPCCMAALAATWAWMQFSAWRRQPVPLLVGNVRLGAAILRAPVVTACVTMTILLIVARHIMEDWILNDYPSLYRQDLLALILADAILGIAAIRPIHLWLLSSYRSLVGLIAFAIVLIATSIALESNSTSGFLAAVVLILGAAFLILLRPFGIEIPFVIRLHRMARLQSTLYRDQ